MKLPLALLFSLAVAVPLLAQDGPPETMENADFSDGTTHWHGDCKPAGSDMTTDFTSSKGSSGGITVDLHSSSWTKVTQEIHEYKGARGSMTLTIVYKTSTDLKLSALPSDYTNAGGAVDFGGAHLNAKPGEIIAFIDKPPATRATQSSTSTTTTYTIYPDNIARTSFVPTTDGSTQTVTATLIPPSGDADTDPTFCIAFPPGSGSVTLLKISLTPGAPGGPGGMPHAPFFHP